MEKILCVNSLSVSIEEEKFLPIVRDISFEVSKNETLCIVGESGCGKTITALSILRLLPIPPFKISGSILWHGKNLITISNEELEKIRGKEISIIFQEPLSSFNPVEKIGDQILEVIEIHNKVDRKEAKEIVHETLKHVGFKNPKIQYELYPHQLSGGMRQRAMIAMAIILKPEMIIADEPTTSLDVTIQAQILNLIERLKEEYGLSLIFITHNLGIVASIAQKVAVFYAGKIVEYTDVASLFNKPLHPYTTGLLSSVPSISKKFSFNTIGGLPPEPFNIPSGCPFHPRCNRKMEICSQKEPPYIKLENNHFVSCWLYGNVVGGKNG
jgi:peptide/nickel transport system ATP-binding protein